MKKSKHIIKAIAITSASLALVGVSLFGAKGNVYETHAVGGSGTKDDPILISIASELEEVMSNVDSGSNDYSNKFLLITNDLSISLNATTNAKTFRGHLDGGGYTITLSTSATGRAVAMFNCVGSAATVSNITFAGNMSGVGHESSTLCSFNYGTISNVINNCSLSSTNTTGLLGGIAASQISASALIENSTNNANISGTQKVGGIVGNLRIGTISNSINTGSITSSNSCCAGIAGLIGQSNDSNNNAIINDCVNEGNISGKGQVGGIAGGIYPQLSCNNCSNYGNITTTANSGAGGIAGYINSADSSSTYSFTNCYSSGTVTTTAGWVGGVFGYASSASTGTISFNNVLSASKVVDTSTTGNDGGFMAGQNSTTASFELVKCYTMASISYSGTGAFSTGIALSKTNIVKNEDSDLPVNNKQPGLELSNTTIKLLRAIREFSCEYDSTMASVVSTGFNNLTSDEIALLDSITYYGQSSDYHSYYVSAIYIKNYLNNGPSGTNRIITEGAFNENSIILIIISGGFVIVGFAFLLFLKKRRNNK